MSGHFIDTEAMHDRLLLLGTIAGLMAEQPENFGRTCLYAMQKLLYDLAKEVWPEGEQAPEPEQATP